MTKKSMYNKKLGLSPLERKRLADLQNNPLKHLQKSYARSKNAFDAWEAIAVIHRQGTASTASPLDYPRWIQDYLGEVAQSLLNADQSVGAANSYLARAIGISGKRPALKRIADAKDFSMFLAVVAEQDRLPPGKKENAYGNVGEQWGGLDAETVRKKFTKIRRKLNRKFPQD